MPRFLSVVYAVKVAGQFGTHLIDTSFCGLFEHITNYKQATLKGKTGLVETKRQRKFESKQHSLGIDDPTFSFL